MLKSVKEYYSDYLVACRKVCDARNKVDDATNFISRWWYGRQYGRAIYVWMNAQHSWLWAKHFLKNTKLGDGSDG